MHPLFHLIATRPHLLLEHMESYGELVGAEAGMVTAGWKRAAVLCAVGVCLLIAGLGLAGVALLLWAVIPTSDMPASWALWVVPLVTLGIAVACFLTARTSNETRAFDNFRRQVSEDMAMLREAD